MASTDEKKDYLDKIVDQYEQGECSKDVVERALFYQKMADKETWEAFAWAVAIPGAGHFYLHCWLEGFLFLFFEVAIAGTVAWLLVKSVIAFFTDSPAYWRVIVWCLALSAVLSIVSLVRVVFLTNRVRTEAAYFMMRLRNRRASAGRS